MLKLCPLFLEGAELYVQIIKAITLLCTTSQLHHKSQIRPRRLLGDLPRLHGSCTCTVPLATCHVRTLPLGPGPQAWGPDTSQLGRLDTDYLSCLPQSLCSKSVPNIPA